MPPRDIDTDRRPFVLVWELTQACELACKHCRAAAQPQPQRRRELEQQFDWLETEFAGRAAQTE